MCTKTRPVMVYYRQYDAGHENRYSIVEAGRGRFHRFGDDYDETPNGHAKYTFAIVERPDGIVETVEPKLIRFLDNG